MVLARRGSFALSKVLVGLAVCLACGPAQAQTTVNKHVSWNVDALVGHTAAPYSLNFQLVDGAGTGNGNVTVTVSNAPFAGFSFDNTAFFQSNSPAFVPVPGTPLEFDVAITYTGTDSPTPDQFSFAVLDNTGFELPTLGPADALATFDVLPAGVTVVSYGADTSRSPNAGGAAINFPAPVITDLPGAVVPEPASALMLLPALALPLIRRRMSR